MSESVICETKKFNWSNWLINKTFKKTQKMVPRLWVKNHFADRHLIDMRVRWDASSREWKSQHRGWRIWDPPKIIYIPFDWRCICSVYLICLKYSGVLFPNGHFQPTPFPNLSNVLSLTPLISLSLSVSRSLPTPHSVFTCRCLI
jgi:hypothetical protein